MKLIEILIFSVIINLSSLSFERFILMDSNVAAFIFISSLHLFLLYSDLMILLFVLLGFLHNTRSELGLEPGSEASSAFHVGQAVKCRVINAVPASRKINLSFIISPKRFTCLFI